MDRKARQRVMRWAFVQYRESVGATGEARREALARAMGGFAACGLGHMVACCGRLLG
jgi:hypothetical protein